jgi:hypothetical protein
MTILNQLQKQWVLIVLIFLMAATRFHHFGSLSFLPDASLAVFFLAGLYMMGNSASAGDTAGKSVMQFFSGGLLIFSLLIFEAGLIDYIAINYGGVSDWCITPAYMLLIPTYALMFFAGKWSARYNPFTIPGTFKMAVVIFIASTLAFLVSNGSFYLFSGRYEEMSWLSYAEQVAAYYLPYAGYTLLYSGLFLAIHSYFKKNLQFDWLGNARYR